MCRRIYDWNIVNCDVKHPIQLSSTLTDRPKSVRNSCIIEVFGLGLAYVLLVETNPFPNLSLFYRTMLFEYPSVLSRFCLVALLCCNLAVWIFVGVGAFVIGLSQISSYFSIMEQSERVMNANRRRSLFLDIWFQPESMWIPRGFGLQKFLWEVQWFFLSFLILTLING